MRYLIGVFFLVVFTNSYQHALCQISKEWTVMVYLNADNNLEEFGLDNFMQMSQVGSSDKVNIIVQMDRNGKYAFTQPQWTQTLRFKVNKGTPPLPDSSVQDMGELDMASPAVLKDFLTWSIKSYPAKKYMLIIWDHGDGWRLYDTKESSADSVYLIQLERSKLKNLQLEQSQQQYQQSQPLFSAMSPSTASCALGMGHCGS